VKAESLGLNTQEASRMSCLQAVSKTSATFYTPSTFKQIKCIVTADYISLDLRGRKLPEAGEDCITRSFITCTLHQILVG